MANDFPKHGDNFRTLCAAVQSNNSALLQVIDPASGETLHVVCAVNRLPNGLLEFIPLATMLDRSLKDLIVPNPMPAPGWTPDQN